MPERGTLNVNLSPGVSLQNDMTSETSLNELPQTLADVRAADETGWRAFAHLALLSPDALLAPPLAGTLWNLAPAKTAPLLARLAEVGLLLPAGEVTVRRRDWPAYRVPAPVRALAHTTLLAPPPDGLGVPALVQAHAALLERYHAQARAGLWHTLPDDGYIHQHLTWHMLQAEQPELLHALLREETPRGRQHGWLRLCDAAGRIGDYLADVSQALALAEGDAGLQIRYQLLETSFNARVQRLPPALLTALVRREVWTWAQALPYARRLPDPPARARALAELAAQSPPEQRDAALAEALSAIRALPAEAETASAWIALAPQFPEVLLAELPDLPPPALPALAAALSGEQRGALLAALAEWEAGPAHAVLISLSPYFDEAQVQQALLVARAWGRSAARDAARAHLAERLAALDCAEAALALLPQIGSEAHRAQALTASAPHLPAHFSDAALRLASGLRSRVRRLEALAGIAPCLPEAIREQNQRQVLAEIGQVRSGPQRADILVGLAAHLSPALWPRVWEVVSDIGNVTARARALSDLAPHLPDAQWTEALRHARALRQRAVQATALSALAARGLALGRDAAALAVVGEIEPERARATALAHLALALPPPLCQPALALAQSLRQTADRVMAFVGLAPALPLPLLRDVVAEVRKLRNVESQQAALEGLAPYLSPLLLSELLAESREIRDQEAQAQALTALLPHLARLGASDEALDVLRGIRHSAERSQALIELGPHLPLLALEPALEAVSGIRSLAARAEAVLGLAPYLPPELLPLALAKIQAIADTDVRLRALGDLAAYLRGLRGGALRRALVVLWNIETPEARMRALGGLLPALPAPLNAAVSEAALAAARSFVAEPEPVQQVGALVPALAAGARGGAVRLAWALARSLAAPEQRVQALVRLAPHLAALPGTEWRGALPALRQIEPVEARVQALIGLASGLSGAAQTEVIVEGVELARRMRGRPRAALLVWLAPRLAALGRPELALVLVREVWAVRQRVNALAAAAPYLAGEHLTAALLLAGEIPYPRFRVRALAGIAPYLPDGLALLDAQQALADVATFRAPEERLALLRTLLPHLPAELQASAAVSALPLLPALVDSVQRAAGLAELGAYLPPDARVAPLAEALQAALAVEGEARGALLTALAPALAWLPEAQMWRPLLDSWAGGTRARMLADVAPLAPALAAHGGLALIRAVVCAIQDVARWWP